MADPHLQVGSLRHVGDPVRRGDSKGAAGVVGKLVGMGDKDRVIVEVLADDVPRAAAETEPATLTDGVKPGSPVATEDLSIRSAADLTRAIAEVVVDKIVERDPAKETDALAVGPIGVGKPEAVCLLPYLRFREISNWKETFFELLLQKLAQEIGLVLFRVGPSQEVKTPEIGRASCRERV